MEILTTFLFGITTLRWYTSPCLIRDYLPQLALFSVGGVLTGLLTCVISSCIPYPFHFIVPIIPWLLFDYYYNYL